METLELLGMALGLASLAGLNLYLTVFLTGMAVRFGWVDLLDQYQSLHVLGNEWVIGVAGVLFFIEFFADKIPWVDSTWDSLHTIIRPAGGIFLAMTALGDVDPALGVIGGLLAGGTSLVTHTAKAGSRLLVNTSPEPVSNVVASVAEDGLVLAGLGLIAAKPALAFFVFLAFVILCILLIRKVWGGFKKGLSSLRRKFSKKEAVA